MSILDQINHLTQSITTSSHISSQEHTKIKIIYQSIQQNHTLTSAEIASLHEKILTLKSTLENKQTDETIWHIFTSNLWNLGQGTSLQRTKDTAESLYHLILAKQCEKILSQENPEASNFLASNDTWTASDFEKALSLCKKSQATAICQKIQISENCVTLRNVLTHKLIGQSLLTNYSPKNFRLYQQCLQITDLEKISATQQNAPRILNSLQDILHDFFIAEELNDPQRNADSPEKIIALFRELKTILQDTSSAYLPKEFILQYTALAHALQEKAPLLNQNELLHLPDYAQSYLEILSASIESSGKAQQIQTLFTPNSDLSIAALAYFINTHKIPLSAFNFRNNESKYKTLSKIAPLLTYVNTKANRNDFVDPKKILPHCTGKNIAFLMINYSDIKNLPNLPNCLCLDCSACPELKSLPKLKRCQKLDCVHCFLLQSIPMLPVCLRLDCSYCHRLRSLPQLLSECRVDCINCSNLTFSMPPPNAPEILNDLQQILNDLQQILDIQPSKKNPLSVDIQEFTTHPQKYLEELGEKHLLANRSFPEIIYQENEKPLEAIDAGGVTRDFLQKLFDALGKGLLIPLIDHDEKGIWPGIDEKKVGIRTLGRLLAICWDSKIDCTTGLLLNIDFFKIIKIPGIDDLSEEALVRAFLTIKNVSQEGADVIFGKKSWDELNETTKTSLSYFLEGEPLQQEDLPKLKEVILEQSLQDKRILSASIIAKEMKTELKLSWDAFLVESPEISQKKIQGDLNPSRLKEQLEWIPGTATEEELNKIRGFLENWIDQADENLLRHFVYFVSGNASLGKTKLKMELYHRGESYIPTAHTCFFSLELSTDYPNESAFKQKLEMAIKEGLAGSGFQIR